MAIQEEVQTVPGVTQELAEAIKALSIATGFEEINRVTQSILQVPYLEQLRDRTLCRLGQEYQGERIPLELLERIHVLDAFIDSCRRSSRKPKRP